jgi:lipopolysaccharide/colanic/teichoic acid biosynthesis glycosyltransferase
MSTDTGRPAHRPTVGGAPNVEGESVSTTMPPRRSTLRRALDVGVAAVVLLVCLPLLVVIGFLIRIGDPGPILFRQTRVGWAGRPFTMLKFRTMRVDCDDNAHREFVTRLITEDSPPPPGADGLFKLTNDVRVTRIGGFLRRTSLDELPQLFNVLRGQMALVGPRPCLPWEAELISRRHQARFLVPPGITGLWQVSGRSRLTMREALDLDVEYVQRQGLLLDLLILVETVPAVLCRQAR